MADFKRVVLLKSIKPSQFFLDEKELEVVFVKSNLTQLAEDVFSTKERVLYEEDELISESLGLQTKKIENYKYDVYDIVYVYDNGELYKVLVF